jgi:hypothetical protein
MIQIPKNITTATFTLRENGVNVTGFPIDIRLSNGGFTFNPVFWEDATDLSLGNNKRSNIRGYDLRVDFSYQISLEESKFEQILDEITKLIDPSFSLYLTVDGTNHIELLPTDGISLAINFQGTIRTGGSNGIVPSLEFESKRLFKKLGDFFVTLN